MPRKPPTLGGDVGRRIVDDQNGLVRQKVLISPIFRERLAPLRPLVYGIYTSLRVPARLRVGVMPQFSDNEV